MLGALPLNKRGTLFIHKHWALLCLLLFTSIYSVVFVTLSLLQHDSFGTGLDLAIYDQYVSNLTRGQFLRNTIVEPTAMWNGYFAPMLGVFIPFYAFGGDARILLVLQTAYLAGSVFPIYWSARRRLGAGLALALAFSFFLYPALEYVNLGQFHVISLTVPLLSLALFFLLEEKYAPLIVCTILSCLVKEEAVFAAFGLGLYILFFRGRRWLGISILLIASIWFLALTNYVFPAVMGRSYFQGRPFPFPNENKSVFEIGVWLLSNPGQVWAIFASAYNLEYVWWLFFPLALVPLVGADVLTISVPIFIMTFVTGTHWLTAHYPSPLIPCMYFAAIAGLSRLIQLDYARFRPLLAATNQTLRLVLGMLILAASLVGYSVMSPGPGTAHFDAARYGGQGASAATYRRLTSLVPPAAVVVAQEELLPHFSARPTVYDFPTIPDYRSADYVVAKQGLYFYDFHLTRWKEWMSSGYFVTVLDSDGFILARRQEPQRLLNVSFGDELTLLGYTLVPSESWRGGTKANPILIWQARRPISKRYTFLVQVVDRQGHVWASTLTEPQGGTSYTNEWTVGKAVGDQYALDLPPIMPTGDYQLAVEVHAPDGAYLDAFDDRGTEPGTALVLSTIHIEKSREPVIASQLEMGQRLYVDMRELRLLGFELAQREFHPGELVPLGLYWRARAKPQGDYIVRIRLQDAASRIVFEASSRPAQGTFPTLDWTEGEALLDWHDWTIPNGLSAGTYDLRVALCAAQDGAVLGDTELARLLVSQ